MKNQLFSFLLIVSMFSLGCGGNNTGSGATTDTVNAAKVNAPLASVAQNNSILFGDPGSGSAPKARNTSKDSMYTGGCNNTGICSPNAGATGVSVNFGYTPGSSPTPSTLMMSFPYHSYFTAQTTKASDFYTQALGPVQTYTFTSSFALATLGGKFASVQATINAASPCTVTFSPMPKSQTAPANVTSNVTVTCPVTP